MQKSEKNKKELLHTPKGVRDLLPADVVIWETVEQKAKEIAEFYGFRPIRTPHIEHAELFTTTVGESTDIVEKQMYAFRTRGKDSLALRPEGTAPIMRSYIQHGMRTWTQPVMLWYSGSFFRHERPQKGRWREFGQFGLEILGTDGAIADALVMRLFYLILEELGVTPIRIHLNTLGDKECRAEWRKDLVGHFRKKINYLCPDCKKRLKTNPLRLLDCTEEKCVEIGKDAPQAIEYVCADCKAHFREVIEFLDKVGIPYFLDHRLVRGLDYYSRTVFEMFVEDGAEVFEEKEQEPAGEQKMVHGNEVREPARPLSVASGGRYDELAYELGLKKSPDNEEELSWKGAMGGALGLDRIVEILKSKKRREKIDAAKIFLIQLGPHAKQQSLLLLEQFRHARMPVASSLAKDSIKNQFQYASQLGVMHTIILGQKEAIEGTAIVRDMETGMQETISQSKLLDYLKKKKKNK